MSEEYEGRIALKRQLQAASEEIHSIRNQLWNNSDEMPMTKKQRDEVEIIKKRLFNLAEKIKQNC